MCPTSEWAHDSDPQALVSVSDKRGVDELARGLCRATASRSSRPAARRARCARPAPGHRGRGLHRRARDPRRPGQDPAPARSTAASSAAPRRAPTRRWPSTASTPIDLVVVNLYPFRETVARGDVTLDEAIENIDIGGPSMVRSAAKNHERVAVVVDPADYARACSPSSTPTAADLRRRCASSWRARPSRTPRPTTARSPCLTSLDVGRRRRRCARAVPRALTLQLEAARELRYGENPHQKAAFYARRGACPTARRWRAPRCCRARSSRYNNMLDLDAALRSWRRVRRPAAAIIKHNNPCGVAIERRRRRRGLPLARECRSGVGVRRHRRRQPRRRRRSGARARPRSSSSASSRPASPTGRARAAGARRSAAPARLPRRRTHGRRRLAAARGHGRPAGADARRSASSRPPTAEVVTKRAPTADELRALDFAWRVCKHVKSNAIVFASSKDGGVRTLGVGAGQMSRVDSVQIAAQKARCRSPGSVLRLRRLLPVPRRRRRGRRGGRDGDHPAGRLGARRRGRSRPPTSTTSRWCSPAMRHFRH